MSLRIDQKIVGMSVKKDETPAEIPPTKAAETSNIVQMHEAFERPETLRGSTIKLKNATLDHALYLTINHIVLNEGTPHETIRPFEIFINTKDPNSQPWIVALTRTISAIWRKGGDFAFSIDELKAVYDPRGGCFLPGGVYVPSTVAHIGLAIEQYLESIGAMKRAELSAEVKAMIDAKKEQLANAPKAPTKTEAVQGAAQCPKCFEFSFVVMDGCSTCLACGHSKCG